MNLQDIGLRKSGLFGLAAVVLAIGMSLPAEAQALNPEGLADGCTSCHGADGHSQGAIPSIGGLDKAKIIADLQAFKAQKGDATIMNRIARGYTDAEFEALADYFSSVKTP